MTYIYNLHLVSPPHTTRVRAKQSQTMALPPLPSPLPGNEYNRSVDGVKVHPLPYISFKQERLWAHQIDRKGWTKSPPSGFTLP